MITEELNKKVCKSLGICWKHESLSDGRCRYCNEFYDKNHPRKDFTTPSGRIQLLQLIEKTKDYTKFILHLWNQEVFGSGESNIINFIYYYLLDLPDRPNFNDRLLDAVLKFKGEENDKRRGGKN